VLSRARRNRFDRSTETRFYLNGVFFESDGSKCRMVSTDGHRLSKVERTIPNGPKLSAGVIIPKKGLLEIKKVLEQAISANLLAQWLCGSAPRAPT
jgi:DNA polymerase-3 subunit beta